MIATIAACKHLTARQRSLAMPLNNTIGNITIIGTSQSKVCSSVGQCDNR